MLLLIALVVTCSLLTAAVAVLARRIAYWRSGAIENAHRLCALIVAASGLVDDQHELFAEADAVQERIRKLEATR